MPVVRHAESRRTETPAALMTTLASPTLGGARRPVWRVDMRPGQEGPPHLIDTEQVWTVLHGSATIDIGGDAVVVAAGDTVVVPGAVPRRVVAGPDAGLAAIVVGEAGARAGLVDGTDKGVPAWVA